MGEHLDDGEVEALRVQVVVLRARAAEATALRAEVAELTHALELERRMHAIAERDARAGLDVGKPGPPPPRHAFEITLRAGANDWESAVDELVRIAEHVEEHGPGCDLVSGNGYVRIERDPEQTEERYREQLRAWCEARKPQPHGPAKCTGAIIPWLAEDGATLMGERCVSCTCTWMLLVPRAATEDEIARAGRVEEASCPAAPEVDDDEPLRDENGWDIASDGVKCSLCPALATAHAYALPCNNGVCAYPQPARLCTPCAYLLAEHLGEQSAPLEHEEPVDVG